MEPAIPELLRRIQAEFLEMPGMRLTEAQARRLWALDATRCSAVLDALVDAQILFRTSDGAVMRVESVGPRPFDRPDAAVATAHRTHPRS